MATRNSNTYCDQMLNIVNVYNCIPHPAHGTHKLIMLRIKIRGKSLTTCRRTEWAEKTPMPEG